MKIAAAQPLPPSFSALASGNAPDELTSSFERLLGDGVTLQVQRGERAFGFSELGLITPGHLAPSVDETASAGSVLQASSEQSEAAVEANSKGLEQSLTNVLLDRPSHPEFTSARTSSPLDLPAHSAKSVIQEFEAVAVERLTPFRTGRQTISETREASAPRTSQTPQSKRFSLIVSEQDGAVQIIAGAPQLSAEARERLRKAAAMLAAEFGVTIGDFIINGALVDAPNPPTGASHGDHPG